jgi:hypothetical protein
MPPKAKQATKIEAVVPVQPVEEPTGEAVSFTPSSGGLLWRALSKHSYGKFQPIAELGDNAAAAILQCSPVDGEIRFKNDFSLKRGSVETVGGQQFPVDPVELARVFTYGGLRPTRLNEHGCGLNTSLAILNPENNDWKIEIKISDDKVFLVQAPYHDKMTLSKTNVYSGQPGPRNGSVVSFPITKKHFQELYASKDAKMTKEEDLHKRIECQISHFWMMNDEVIEGKIKLYYNDVYVPPFSLHRQDICTEYIDDYHNSEIFLDSGAVVKIEQYKLSDKARRGIPGSTWFKFGLNHNGVYLFKNGRFIEEIHGDDERKLYSRFIGAVPDNHQNGMVILVNMKGTQEQLPHTTPTKNRFPESTLLNELVCKVNEKIIRPKGHEHHSEEQKVAKFKENLERSIHLLPRNPYPHFKVEQEKTFKMNDKLTSPKLDLVATYDDSTVQVFEAKDKPAVLPEYIQQLHFYWLLLKSSPELEGKELQMALLCDLKDDWKPNDNLLHYISLYSESGFTFEVWNYSMKKLL